MISIICFIIGTLFLFTADQAIWQVTGFVVNEEEDPVTGHQVYLYNPYNELVSSDLTDEQGRFELEYFTDPTSAEPGTGNGASADVPAEFALGASYPNPFNPRTIVPFQAPEDTRAVIGIYDMLGREVYRVQADINRGHHDIMVNLGGNLSQGHYLLRVMGEGYSLTRTMTFVSAGISGGVPGISVRPGASPQQRKSAQEVRYTDIAGRYRIVVEETDEYSGLELDVPPMQNFETGRLILSRKDKNGITYGRVTDVDGNEYQTVVIGDQEWMAGNLRVTRYRDESPVPTGLSHSDWSNTTEGAYAVYQHVNVSGLNSDEEVALAYGLLYNWFAASDSRGLCPAGWRVPSDADWWTLVNHVVAQGYPNSWDAVAAGNALKSRRQVGSPLGSPWATSDQPRWESHFIHHGTDVFGFAALPGGRRANNGTFLNVGLSGTWWSSTGTGSNTAWSRGMSNSEGMVFRDSDFRQFGFSVRCVKD